MLYANCSKQMKGHYMTILDCIHTSYFTCKIADFPSIVTAVPSISIAEDYPWRSCVLISF